jgi:hypothetical protein
MLLFIGFCAAAGTASHGLLGLLCAILRGDQSLAYRCVGLTALAAVAGNFAAIQIIMNGGI